MLAALSGAAWIALLIATRGRAVPVLALAAVIVITIQSRVRAHVRGTAIRISENQYPALHEGLLACAERLGLKELPDAYLLRERELGPVARRLLGRRCLVLPAELVEALADRPGAIRFLLGRELGRSRGPHPLLEAFIAPAAWLPLLGTAYRRAREYAWDRSGAVCCDTDDDVTAALTAFAAGRAHAAPLNRAAYLEQIHATRGLSMSFHELTSDTPWLVKRLAAALTFRHGQPARHPRRHPVAWLLAALVPRLGPTGTGIAGALVKLAIVAIIAALAIAAYRDYANRARISDAFAAAQPVLDAVEAYAFENDAWPESLLDLGYTGEEIRNPRLNYTIAIYEDGIVGIDTGLRQDGAISYLVLEPVVENDTLEWLCYGQDLDTALLPADCR